MAEPLICNLHLASHSRFLQARLHQSMDLGYTRRLVGATD
jgi:hypothetical protein